jgi:DNA-binding winged helix-turn-helix (wHTH) protein
LADKEDNPELYDTVSAGLMYLKQSNTEVSVAGIETLLVLRILHNLGYVGEDPLLKQFLGESVWSNEVVGEASKELQRMVSAVNRSFRDGLD